jgi:hypothetical protein
MTNTAEVISITQDKPLAVYNEFRTQLQELKQRNAMLVFDYTSKSGNKEARSYVHTLRRTKTAVDAARKAEKAASLEYGRKVDAEAKEIIGQVEEMIDVHQSELDRIEREQMEREAAIRARLEAINFTAQELLQAPSSELKDVLAKVKSIALDESFGELLPEAALRKDDAITKLEAAIIQVSQREAEQEEYARLKADADAREMKERQERLIAEEQERQKAAVEAALKAERERAEREAAQAAAAAENRERDAAEKLAQAEKEMRDAEARRIAEFKKAEDDRIAAQAKAIADRETAVLAEKLRVQQEAERKAAEDAKREADQLHVATIQQAVAAALRDLGMLTEAAHAVVQAMHDGQIPHVKIVY